MQITTPSQVRKWSKQDIAKNLAKMWCCFLLKDLSFKRSKPNAINNCFNDVIILDHFQTYLHFKCNISINNAIIFFSLFWILQILFLYTNNVIATKICENNNKIQLTITNKNCRQHNSKINNITIFLNVFQIGIPTGFL